MVVPGLTPLEFAGSSTSKKSEGAILQLGYDEAKQAAAAQGGVLTLDCGFCGREYRFDDQALAQLFADGLSNHHK